LLLLSSSQASQDEAGMRRLSDAELAQVSGQATPPTATPGLTAPALPNAATEGLARGLQAELLDRPAFLAALAARGVASLPESIYRDAAGLQLAFHGDPVSFEISLADLLGAAANGRVNASLGQLTVRALDMRGSTLWTWNH
jgi:hypothetical protein